MKTLIIIKSLLTSLCQREEKSPLERGVGVCYPSLAKRGEGRFFNNVALLMNSLLKFVVYKFFQKWVKC
jgi:hypothetical protein